MGNAVNTLFQKKIEARKKQAEKEREIFQACLALAIEQEERKKKEAAEKQEKIRKEKEIKRINRDHDLMERYLKNIEKEAKREHEEWKKRDKEKVKRKREVNSAHERRIRKQEEHIKHESEIISKNIAMIEKKSIQSRQEMKARIASMAQKRKNDNKEFLKKTHTAEHDRKKEIENNKRRIRFIEKKIVEDRIQWQQKLMSARGIPTDAKISTQKLWSIGRQTVEKRKNKENFKSDKTLSKKNISKESTTVKKTLSSVEEEEIAVLDDDTEQITQIAIAQTSRSAEISRGVNTKKDLDTQIIKHADSKQFQRFYVPQKGATSSQGQITIRSGADGEILSKPRNTHITPRTAARDKIFAPSNSSRSSRKTEIPGNRNPEQEDIKSQGQVMATNLNNNNNVENKTKTVSRENENVGTEIKGSQENTQVSKKQKYKDDSSREKSYTGVNNLTEDTSPRLKMKQEGKQPKGIVGKRHEVEERKRIVTMSDPLMPKSLSLKQSEVENMIGIKPLSSSKDTAASTKNIAFETKQHLPELTLEMKKKELTDDKEEVKKPTKAEISTKLSPGTHNDLSQDKDFNFLFLTASPTDAIDRPKVTINSTTEVNNNHIESTDTAVAPRTKKLKDVIGSKTPNVTAKNGSIYAGAHKTREDLSRTTGNRDFTSIDTDRNTGNRDCHFTSIDTDRGHTSSRLILLQDKEKQGAFTTETKTEKKIRTIRVKPSSTKPSNAGVFVVNQNISEVQRRIDHMVKLHTNDIPVV